MHVSITTRRHPGVWRWRAVVVASGLVTVAPIWLSPLLVTTDGPSHLYNAFVAYAVRSGAAPFASYLEYVPGVGRTRISELLLMWFGPLLGWEGAERLVLSVAVGGALAVLVLLVAATPGPPATSLVPAAGWLAQSWFTWMGFYDFVLSLAVLGLLVIMLRARPLTHRHLLGAQLLLAMLFWTHLFTLAIGVGLLGVVVLTRLVMGELRPGHMLVVVPGAALVVLSLGLGPGSDGVAWSSWVKVVAGLFVGDFVVSFHRAGLLAGVLLMGLVWVAVGQRGRRWFAGSSGPLDGTEVFGLLLLLGSLVAPDRIGEGSYIPARMRFLSVVILLPMVAQYVVAVRRPWQSALVIAWLASLTFQGVFVIRSSRRVERDLADMRATLERVGAHPGSWIAMVTGDAERHLFRISGYLHVVDRAALTLRMVQVDNYEAELRSFPVNWCRRPDRLTYRNADSSVVIAVRERELPLAGSVFVVHESHVRIVSGDVRATIGRRVDSGAFATTVVTIEDSDAPGPGDRLARSGSRCAALD